VQPQVRVGQRFPFRPEPPTQPNVCQRIRGGIPVASCTTVIGFVKDIRKPLHQEAQTCEQALVIQALGVSNGSHLPQVISELDTKAQGPYMIAQASGHSNLHTPFHPNGPVEAPLAIRTRVPMYLIPKDPQSNLCHSMEGICETRRRHALAH